MAATGEASRASHQRRAWPIIGQMFPERFPSIRWHLA